MLNKGADCLIKGFIIGTFGSIWESPEVPILGILQTDTEGRKEGRREARGKKTFIEPGSILSTKGSMDKHSFIPNFIN